MKKRKVKDLTEQEWQEIIAYANSNTITGAAVKYNIYADSIKYKIDPELREKKKAVANKKYADIKADPEKWAAHQEHSRQIHIENREARSEYHKKWLRENWEERQAYCKQHYEEHKSEIRLKSIRKYEELKANPEEYEKYRQKCAENRKKYRTREYKDKYNAKCRKIYAESIKKRIKCFIYSTLGRLIKTCKQRALQKGITIPDRENQSIAYLGCSIDEFMHYIESQFLEGMTWDNYGEWEIDHILPLSLINENTEMENQLLALCNYKNCKPLWAYDNNSKNDSLQLNFCYTPSQLQDEFNIWCLKHGNYNARVDTNKLILHFQPHFYSVANEVLSIKTIRNAVIANRETILKKPYYELTQEEILNGLKYAGLYKGYSHFSPLWFKAFIEEYNIKTCYDPCGGWGHRLLGAQSLENYIYNDAWDKTVNGVNEIIKQFKISNTVTYNNDCSTFTPQEDYEAIFTCPPYYNLELYDEKNKFKSENQFKGWWDSTMQHALKSSVHILGVVTDQYTIKLLQPIIEKYMKYEKQITVGTSKSKHNMQYLTIFTK